MLPEYSTTNPSLMTSLLETERQFGINSINVLVGFADLKNSTLPFQVSKQGLNVLIDVCSSRLEMSSRSEISDAIHDALTYAFCPHSCQNEVLEFLGLKWGSQDIRATILEQM